MGLEVLKKIEKIQERALRFLYNDFESSYKVLLEKYGHKTLHFKRIKALSCEIFKTLNDLNPSFMEDHLSLKEVSYEFRDESKLILPKFNTVRYGKNTFTYYGAHIWNLVPGSFKKTADINVFKSLLKTWEGPKCQCNLCDVF